MAYCTSADIETRIGPADLAALADHDGDGNPDGDVVTQAIRSAESLMDSYIGVRYAVPVELPGGGCPEVVTTRAVNLAVYFLRLGRDSVTEDARAQYEDDVRWLTQVAAGRVSLGVEPAPTESGGAATVRAESAPRLFGRSEPL
jgi:phage gp36-like protein